MEIIKAEELRKTMEEKFYSTEIRNLALEVVADKVMRDIKKAAEVNTLYFYEFNLENIIHYMDISAQSATDNYYKVFRHLTYLKNCFEADDKGKYQIFVSQIQLKFIDAGYNIIQEEGLKNRYIFTISWKNKKKDEN